MSKVTRAFCNISRTSLASRISIRWTLSWIHKTSEFGFACFRCNWIFDTSIFGYWYTTLFIVYFFDYLLSKNKWRKLILMFTISSGLNIPNWTRFTSLYGADESDIQAFRNAIFFSYLRLVDLNIKKLKHVIYAIFKSIKTIMMVIFIEILKIKMLN
jgi:hypothetical protein